MTMCVRCFASISIHFAGEIHLRNAAVSWKVSFKLLTAQKKRQIQTCDVVLKQSYSSVIYSITHFKVGIVQLYYIVINNKKYTVYTQ